MLLQAYMHAVLCACPICSILICMFSGLSTYAVQTAFENGLFSFLGREQANQYLVVPA
ncbi:hypothetical protein K440DRAFT_395909 [Wilcoxina mikolae CBS 423.85]|nr:hypothetical protein K440DRAFT_395909 [Wilcoxina mikolae CBS 423.85]